MREDLIDRLRNFENSDELGNGDFSLLHEAAAALEAARGHLRDFATGKLRHVYRGGCPDQVNGPDARDPACPACQAIEAARFGNDADTIRALLEERYALAKDAARYRWLRKGNNDDIAVVRGLGAMDYGMSGVAYTYSEEIDDDALDAAIDAAMAKENE